MNSAIKNGERSMKVYCIIINYYVLCIYYVLLLSSIEGDRSMPEKVNGKIITRIVGRKRCILLTGRLET